MRCKYLFHIDFNFERISKNSHIKICDVIMKDVLLILPNIMANFRACYTASRLIITCSIV